VKCAAAALLVAAVTLTPAPVEAGRALRLSSDAELAAIENSALFAIKRHLLRSRKEGNEGNEGDEGDEGNEGNEGDEGNEGNEGDEGDEGNEGNEGDEGNEGNEGDEGDEGEFSAARSYASLPG
jgi:Collagen triple helix repeat (20 copies)